MTDKNALALQAQISFCHKIVKQALAAGVIKKADACSSCNQQGVRLLAHHKNYNEPLQVKWICYACHAKMHNKTNDVCFAKTAEIAQQIRAIRIARGMTMQQFASKVGITVKMVWQLENMKISRPQYKTIRKLQKAFPRAEFY